MFDTTVFSGNKSVVVVVIVVVIAPAVTVVTFTIVLDSVICAVEYFSTTYNFFGSFCSMDELDFLLCFELEEWE